MADQKQIVEEMAHLKEAVKTVSERISRLETNIEANNTHVLDVLSGLVQKVRISQDTTNERITELEKFCSVNENHITEVKNRLDKNTLKSNEIVPQLETTVRTHESILKGISQLEGAVKVYQHNSTEAISHFASICSKNETNVSDIIHNFDEANKSTNQKMSQIETTIAVNHNNVTGGMSRLEDIIRVSHHTVNERLSQLEEILSINHENMAKRIIRLEEMVEKANRRMCQIEETIDANKNNILADALHTDMSEKTSKANANDKISKLDTERTLKNVIDKLCYLESMKNMCDKIPQLEETIASNQETFADGMNRFEWFMDSIFSSNIIERISFLEESVNKALSVLPKVETLLSNPPEPPPPPVRLPSIPTTPSSSSTSSTGQSTRTSTFTDSTSTSRSVVSAHVVSTTDSTSTSNNDLALSSFKGFLIPSSSASPADSTYSTANSSASAMSPITISLPPDVCSENQNPREWLMFNSPQRKRNSLMNSLHKNKNRHQETSREFCEDVDPDYNKDNALFVACRVGQARHVRMLLKAGANVHRKDCSGCTPLHMASAFGKVDCVRALLSAGADRNAKDDAGFTPLELAQNEEVKEILQQSDRRFHSFFNRFLSRK